MFNGSNISMVKNQIGSMNRVLRVVEIIHNGCVLRSLLSPQKKTKINLSTITLFVPFRFIKIFRRFKDTKCKCIFIYIYICFARDLKLQSFFCIGYFILIFYGINFAFSLESFRCSFMDKFLKLFNIKFLVTK